MRVPTPLLLCVALALAACSQEPAKPAPNAGAGGAAPPAAAQPAPPVEDVVRVEPPAGGLPEVRYYVLHESCPYCRDIRGWIEGHAGDASGETLMKLYAGKANFTFLPAYTAKFDPTPGIEAFGFGGAGHGIAGIRTDGRVAFTVPGHHFTRSEVIEHVDAMLR